MMSEAHVELPSGILNVDKPPGISSARVVARVKRLLPRGVRVGHAGTLDPFATGVLLVLIGRATRCCERLMDSPKQYETTVQLGANTATDDPESPPMPVAEALPLDRARVETALGDFVGQIQQRPPAYSAMKIGGRRAYKLARAGHAVPLAPRTVSVDAIELLEYQWPRLRLRIDCGRGVYIRAIARDLGEKLGVGGYLSALRRTRVGAFWATDAVSLEQLAEDGIARHLRQVEAAEPAK